MDRNSTVNRSYFGLKIDKLSISTRYRFDDSFLTEMRPRTWSLIVLNVLVNTEKLRTKNSLLEIENAALLVSYVIAAKRKD